MVFRHSLLRVNQRKHRALWPIVSPHLPLPSSTPLASFHYTDLRPFVDPIGEDFLNTLEDFLAHIVTEQNPPAEWYEGPMGGCPSIC